MRVKGLRLELDEMHKFVLEIKINGPNSRIHKVNREKRKNVFILPSTSSSLGFPAQEGTSCMLIVHIVGHREVEKISREKSRIFHSFIKVKIVYIFFLVLFHLF